MAALAAFFLSSGASAQELTPEEMYLTIKGAPTVTWVDEEPVELWGLASNEGGEGGLGALLDDVDVNLTKIINIGKRVWDIVAANRPVVNTRIDTASAMPEGVSKWTDLQGWQPPFSRLYHFTYENLYGMKVVDFSYRVTFFHGGNVRGKGRYVANATIAPARLSVVWGYTFNAKAMVPTIVNAGTHDSPVAGMQLTLDWKIDTIVKHEEASQSYFVRGDGAFAGLNGGQRLGSTNR